jgi:hypothetical protein
MNETHKVYPTRRQALVFGFKSTLLKAWRGLKNQRHPVVQRTPGMLAEAVGSCIGSAESALWSDGTPAERALQLGKVENLRRAARFLDGIDIPADQVFSFWRQVGRPTRRRGFATGRELRQGCIIPNVGGGLCQLSNGIYQAALQAGLTIVERHPHTQVVPGSHAEIGQDATVFWNYLDLRLSAPFAWRLEVRLDEQHLRVRILRQNAPATSPSQAHRAGGRTVPILAEVPGSCDCCGQLACYLNIEARHPEKPAERSAYLLDNAWPEFADWVARQDRRHATLLQSWDGTRWGKANYAWPNEGWANRRSFPLFAIRRALTLRRLAQQGAARQNALLRYEAQLAALYARQLGPEITHLVVTQPLLPHLQALGVLAGRRVDVLMLRAPLDHLQATLDDAASRHPDSRTLGDFRADTQLVARERRALDDAHRLITPHRHLAEQACRKAELLEWTFPPSTLPPLPAPNGRAPTIAFLGPTAGRRGALEAREAFRQLMASDTATSVRLVTLGSQLEGKHFWRDLPVENRSPVTPANLADVDILLTPAWIDHAPRQALALLAADRWVLASTTSGLPDHPKLIRVPPGDTAALSRELQALCRQLTASAIPGTPHPCTPE